MDTMLKLLFKSSQFKTFSARFNVIFFAIRESPQSESTALSQRMLIQTNKITILRYTINLLTGRLGSSFKQFVSVARNDSILTHFAARGTKAEEAPV